MQPQQDPTDQPDENPEVGESAFLSHQLNDQTETQSDPAESNPTLIRNRYKPGRKRRWFLHFSLASIILITIGSIFQNLADRGWRKAKSVAKGLLPESLFEDNEPTRKNSSNSNNGVQTEKLENEEEYRAFITALNLKYISPSEVIRPHKNIRNGVKNELPPKRYWKRLEKCLKVADALREELSVPLKVINSAYRSPDYNAQCNGAVSNSYHTKNLALDLVFACSSKEAAKAAKKLRTEGVFKGGIGVYSSFIHIDTRGRNADWGISV